MTHCNEANAAPAVAFVTLGCAKNEVDTVHMRGRLREAGFALTDDPARAQAVVVNTCSFIQSATEESLEAIFDAARLPNVAAGAPLIVAGCMPARYGDDLAEELTEARAFVPCSREDDIAKVVTEALDLDVLPVSPVILSGGGEVAEVEGSRAAPAEIPAVPPVILSERSESKDPSKAGGAAAAAIPPFAYVKISDGCDRFCSYCTIPYIRGRYRSFPLEDIRVEVAAHVAAGVREIVLIAQDTGRWGTDFASPSSLAALVDTLAGEFPDTWLRVMYLQPEGVTDEYLNAVAAHPNVCSYFDIPLQHVDPAILRAMNRTGSRAEFQSLVQRILRRLPDATLRTTLIAGFPGETEEQFEELCDFVEEGLFHYVGVFPYSREEGTRAFDLPDQVDDDEKTDRAQRVRDLADAVCTPRIAERIGRTLDVLVEGAEEDGQLFGRAMCQAPEVDGVTYLAAGRPGEIRRVRITDTLLYEMEGK